MVVAWGRYMGMFSQCDGWALSDIRYDYKRMGLDQNKDWQVARLVQCTSNVNTYLLLHAHVWQFLDNSDFSLVETYPPYLVLPAALSDKNIQLAAAFRSKCRLPVVTYYDGVSGCVLLRSAQPLVGITLQTSSADQLLLNYCRLSGSVGGHRWVYVICCLCVKIFWCYDAP